MIPWGAWPTRKFPISAVMVRSSVETSADAGFWGATTGAAGVRGVLGFTMGAGIAGGVGALGRGATETVCSRGAGGGAVGREGGVMTDGGMGAAVGVGATGRFIGGVFCGAAGNGGGGGGTEAAGRAGIGAGAVAGAEPAFCAARSCSIPLMRAAFGVCGWSAIIWLREYPHHTSHCMKQKSP